MKRLLVIALVVAACGSAAGHSINGTFRLKDSGVAYNAGSCTGSGGYSDIKPGLGVTVKDETGKTIGNGSLAFSAESQRGECVYAFTIPVPDAEFYTVTVGRRGDLTYSKADMEGQAWLVTATLGGS